MHGRLRTSVGVLAALALVACGSGEGGDDAADTGSSSGGSAESSGATQTGSGSSPTGADTTAGSDSGSETGTGDTGTDGNVEVWELRAGGFQPPNVETYYSCFSFQFEVDELHHIVGFEPAVTSPIIHHYVLSMSDTPVELDPAEPCFEWPAQILWAWAPGIQPQMLPEEAGFLVGDAPGGVVTLILQVHYNNPLLEPLQDNDGVDVLVTPDLRPNAAGILSQGDIGSIAIPPGQSDYVHTATCGAATTSSLLGHEIHVFSSFLHAHEIGAAITSEVFRNGNPVGQIAVEDPFDFNSQKFVPADIDIMPGDEIETRCVYDSTGRTETTMGGVASEEEMCINFMMYYPEVAGEKCGSL